MLICKKLNDISIKCRGIIEINSMYIGVQIISSNVYFHKIIIKVKNQTELATRKFYKPSISDWTNYATSQVRSISQLNYRRSSAINQTMRICSFSRVIDTEARQVWKTLNEPIQQCQRHFTTSA